MLQTKESNRYSLYGMTSVVVLFAYPIKSIDPIKTALFLILHMKAIMISLADQLSVHALLNLLFERFGDHAWTSILAQAFQVALSRCFQKLHVEKYK